MRSVYRIYGNEATLPAGIRQGVCCTYLLLCADGSLYCGWTNDLEKRLRSHSGGTGGKYTRSRLPVQLVYAETFDTKAEAMSREWELKQLSRAEKWKLVRPAEDQEGQAGERS